MELACLLVAPGDRWGISTPVLKINGKHQDRQTASLIVREGHTLSCCRVSPPQTVPQPTASTNDALCSHLFADCLYNNFVILIANTLKVVWILHPSIR